MPGFSRSTHFAALTPDSSLAIPFGLDFALKNADEPPGAELTDTVTRSPAVEVSVQPVDSNFSVRFSNDRSLIG